MKNNRPLFFVMLAGGLFILLLKYGAGGSDGLSETKTNKGDIEQELRSEIATFRSGSWDETIYRDLETRVGSAEMAHEISRSQYDDLSTELSLAKRDALIRSFDEIRQAACSDPTALRPVVREMETHKVNYGEEQLKERITMFRHLEQFLSLEGAVKTCLAKMYSASMVSGITSRIASSSSLSGVSDCPACQVLVKQWTSQIRKLEGIDKSFNFYIKQRSMSFNACETFKPYTYYYEQLVSEGLCFK